VIERVVYSCDPCDGGVVVEVLERDKRKDGWRLESVTPKANGLLRATFARERPAAKPARKWEDVAGWSVVKTEADRIFGLKPGTCDAFVRVGLVRTNYGYVRGTQAFRLYKIGDILDVLRLNGLKHNEFPPDKIASRIAVRLDVEE
jgi:hypothetical protein